ncbi:hypothetical protein MSWHS_0695 [Methanosarcina sp. WWM596]|nr:hypothetical protein MSWHS_0695 [Methanosarcina sp. WWM596]
MSIVPFEAQAASGSYTLKWYAADPSLNSAPYLPTYEKLTPASLPSPGLAGRYPDPLANAVAYGPTSSNLDALSSLSPENMALGQVVPFEMVISVSGSTSPENGTINFTTIFDANTTSGSNFGFDPAYGVYAAFVDTADVGTNDPLNNSKVESFTSILTGSGSSQEIQGTFQVSGLDDGDRVVVEIWVVLKSTIPTGITGNVQTSLDSAQTATGDSIKSGKQTVSLLQVGKFFSSDADVSVVKTDNPDPEIQGKNLTYNIIVKNNSPDTIANGIVVNDALHANTTFVSATGAPYTISGNTITFSVGALSPGQSDTMTIATTVLNTAGANNDTSINSEPGTSGPLPALYDLLDTVSVTAITDDSNTANNIYYQPTNVLLANPIYMINKVVTDVAGEGPAGEVTSPGDVISYKIYVNNTGNVDLTNVIVNDSLINLTGPAGDNLSTGILNPGESWTYIGNYTVTQEDLDTNGGGDGLINNTATVDCDQLDPKSRIAEVPIRALPEYMIKKIVIDIGGRGPIGNVSAGETITYLINVSNIGNVDLTNVTVNDSLLNLTGPNESLNNNSILEVEETWTYTGNYTVTLDDANNSEEFGSINNTATVDCDQLEPISDSAEVPLEGIPAYIIHKFVLDVAGRGPAAYVTDVGDVITYQVNVSNVGNVSMTSVNVSDTLINLTGPNESLNIDSVLEMGETWTYTGNYTVTQQDINGYCAGNRTIKNVATVDCDECVQLTPKSDTAEVPIKATPGYMINKVAIDVGGRGPDGYVTSVGDVINYSVVIENTGNTYLTNVSVNDTLINLTGPIESLNTDGILEVEEIWTFTGNYTVTHQDINSNGGGDGLIENTATVWKPDCDQLVPKSYTAEVLIGIPVYIIEKTITDIAGEGPNADITAAGDIISYQVNISNIGNLDLTNITVNDSLINLTGPAGDNPPNDVLDVGEVWTYTGNYTVTQEAINNTIEGKGFINNTATVNSTQVGPINDSANAPISLPIAYSIRKRVTDAAGKGPDGYVTAAGDVITYRINVTNTGQVNLTNVTVNDSLVNLTGPTESLNPDSILEIGEIWIYNGTYTVNQTDIYNNGGGDGFIENTATVSSDQLASKLDIAQVPIVQIPELTIDKSASPMNYSEAGQNITYTYNVTNSGNVNITSPINVTDDKLGVIPLTSGILVPGQNEMVTLDYTITQSDLDSGLITNEAFATGIFGNNTTVSNTDNVTVTADQIPELTIEKSAAPTNYSEVGQNITYTYNVTNSGNVNITAPINVTDDKLGVIPLTSGILIPGQSESITWDYTITQSDLNNGSVTNTAFVSGLFAGNFTNSTSVNATVTAEQNPELTIEKSAAPTNYSSVGENITYTYNVTNSGNVNITTPINVTDDKLGVIPLTSGILIPGQSESITWDYTITQSDLDSGLIANEAFATGIFNGTEINSTNVTATVTAIQIPELTIEKSASPMNYSEVGQNITYTFNVTNSGNVNITRLVNVMDDKLGVIPLTSRILIPGQSKTIMVNYTITQSDINNGSVTNTAFVSGLFASSFTNSTLVNATVTAIQIPELTIDKSASPMNYSEVGQNITYTFNVTNSGNVNITSPINVTDDKLGVIPLTSEILIPGQSEMITVNYTITQSDLNNRSVTNTAFVSGLFAGNFTNSTPVNATITAIQIPELTIEKSASPMNYSKVGQNITYTFNVTNSGNVNITGLVNVMDDKLGVIPITSRSLIPGQSETITVNYTITQSDLNNGSVTNTAFVSGLFASSFTNSTLVNATVTAIQIPELTIDKSASPMNYSEAGQNITYTYNITNSGNVDITGLVNVTDDKLGVIPLASEILIPGQSETITVNYTITQSDLNNGSVTNTAFVSGLFAGSFTNSTSVNATVIADQNPACTIDKIVQDVSGKGPEGRITIPGDIITYQIVVANTGNVDLTNVTVTDIRIENLTGPDESLNENRVLETGENWIYIGTYTVTLEDIINNVVNGFIENTATVECDHLDPRSDSVRVPIGGEGGEGGVIPEEKPDCTIDKTVIDVAGKGPAGTVTASGEIITYQIVVTNTGNFYLTGISVTDSLIQDLNGPEESLITDGVLEQGESWVYTGYYMVTEEDIISSGEEDGFIVNTATVECDLLGPRSDSAAVLIEEEQIPIKLEYCISKSVIGVDEAGDCIINEPGDIISYQIVVENEGNVDLTGVEVNDSLIQTLDGPVESLYDDSVLGIGENWTYTGCYMVTLEDIETNGHGDGCIENIATVVCDQLDAVSDSAEVPIGEVPIDEYPDYAIEKTVTDVGGKGPAETITQAGDIISYKIVVENEGYVDLTGIKVNDSLIQILDGPVESLNNDSVLGIGENWTYTGCYTVTLEDIETNGHGDGCIENIATVVCDQLDAVSDSAEVPIGEEPTQVITEYCISKLITGIDEAGDRKINEAGDIIEYQIVVKNEGNVDLTGVSVSDPMITLTGPIGDDVDSGMLNPGESWKFFGNYTVTQEDISSNGEGDGFIENTATVTCNELPEENSSIKQPILLGSEDEKDNADTQHHGNGGTGSARVVSKSVKDIEVSENKEENDTVNDTGTQIKTSTEIQSETDNEDVKQNKESIESDVEKKQEEKQEGNRSVPGFTAISGIIGMLAIFLCISYKRK